MRLVNVADLKDKNGKTFRENNNALKHKLKVGDHVATYDNMVLYITSLSRDCDGTPLYNLGDDKGSFYTGGYGEEDIKLHVRKERGFR